jgi:hypothetical protein
VRGTQNFLPPHPLVSILPATSMQPMWFLLPSMLWPLMLSRSVLLMHLRYHQTPNSSGTLAGLSWHCSTVLHMHWITFTLVSSHNNV